MRKINIFFCMAAFVFSFTACAIERKEGVNIVKVDSMSHGLTVVFWASVIGPDSIHSLEWDMNQENPSLDDHRFGDTVSFTYPRAGSYLVRLEGVDGLGHKVSDVHQLTLCPSLIRLSYTIDCSTATLRILNPTEFDGKFNIDFGDGSAPIDTMATVVVHTYPNINKGYQVEVAATQGGCKANGTIDVSVKTPPTVSLAFGRVGTIVEFANTTINGPSNFQWDFGDGNTNSIEPNTVHQYAAGAVYPIKLSVNACEVEYFKDTSIVVEPPLPPFVSPYSKSNLFHSLNTIAVPPYSDGNYNILGDASPLFGFPHQEHIDTMGNNPLFRWKHFFDPEHLMVVVSKARIVIHDGGIANVDDLIWAWNDGMEGELGNVHYNDGKPMVGGHIDYDENHDPVALEPGQVYYWCVYGWNADLSRIAFSSKEFPFQL